jgi:hypothetical protein
VKPAPNVSCDDVPTTRLSPLTEQILGGRRPSGWVLQKLNGGRGLGRGIIHTIDSPSLGLTRRFRSSALFDHCSVTFVWR